MKDLMKHLAKQEHLPTPLASGTQMSIAQFAEAESVVDLSRLQLDTINIEDSVVRIGAQVSLQTVIEAPSLQKLADGILPQACSFAAHLGLRHLSTLGGVLLNQGGAPEIILALLALDANIVIVNTSMTTMPLSEYQPKDGDVIVEIMVKLRDENCRGTLTRVARTPLDEAIVAVAAVKDEKVLRVAASGAHSENILIATTAEIQNDQVIEQVLKDAQPIEDYRGSAEYRRTMAGVLAKRALQTVLGRN